MATDLKPKDRRYERLKARTKGLVIAGVFMWLCVGVGGVVETILYFVGALLFLLAAVSWLQMDTYTNNSTHRFPNRRDA